MTFRDADNPPTARELAARSNSGGSVCPKCGRVLITYKTIKLETNIIRYRRCDTPGCDRRYMTSQEHQKLIREVMPDDDENSNSGNPSLTLRRESA